MNLAGDGALQKLLGVSDPKNRTGWEMDNEVTKAVTTDTYAWLLGLLPIRFLAFLDYLVFGLDDLG